MPSLESILEPLDRIEIVVPVSADARELFRQVAEVHDNRKVELTGEGHIVVMAPAGLEGGYLSGEVHRQLANWAVTDRTGKAFDSSAGFYITPQENRSPDAAWVSNGRIESIPKKDRKGFAPFCPDFAIEVKSPLNGLAELRAKCLKYVECGAFEAWLIDPERKTVEIYVSNSIVPREFSDALLVSGSGPLAGFRLDLVPIWAGLYAAPVFCNPVILASNPKRSAFEYCCL